VSREDERFLAGLRDARDRDRLARMIGYARSADACRRRSLLGLIGQPPVSCAGCDVCDGTAAEDAAGARESLSLVAAHPRRFTAARAAEVLAGRPTPRVVRGFLDGIGGFGALAGWERGDVEEAIGGLVATGRLRVARWPWRGKLTSAGAAAD
jgi:superfamily II DNA helicase RecQ